MTASPREDRHGLEVELQRVADLDLKALKARWLELKGVPLPKFIRRGLAMRAVAHAIQKRALGGLDRATQRKLDQLVEQIVPSGVKPPRRPNRIKTGTRLVREWNGRIYEVTVLPDGFEWKGERHRSLSMIARKITGTRWNGWVFFGLKKPAALPKDTNALPARPPRRVLRPRAGPDLNR